MRIGIDIDNVISNFNEELLKAYIEHDKELRNTGIVNKNASYIRNDMFDWSNEEESSFYINNIERIAKKLELIENADKYINKLKEEGHKIYIISGRDNGEYTNPYDMTTSWLKNHNIKYDELILTNAYYSDEKAKICEEKNIDVMIDDSSRVCNSMKKHNIKSIIMDTPYNKQEKETLRAYSWKELYCILNNKKVNVILDTDTYNECDDQFALSYLLKSQNLFNIDAITIAPYSHKKRNVSVEEGQELSYNEVLKICKWLNFDTTNKVFKGSMNYLVNGYNEENEAVDKIIEIAKKNNKTYILGIGAITNIALAIKKEPKIIDKIEVIWLGGNEPRYKGNLEFNFRQDVEAVKIVFESEVELTIIPCKDVASILRTNIEILNENMKDNELNTYLKNRFYNDGYHGIQESRVIWDISVIAYMINKNWFEMEDINSPNIKEDTSYEINTTNHKIKFVTKIDKDEVYNGLFKKLGEK